MRIPSEDGQGLHQSEAMHETEKVAIENWVKVLQAITRLRDSGFTVEVSDIGRIFTAVKGNATYKLDTAGLLELARLEESDGNR